MQKEEQIQLIKRAINDDQEAFGDLCQINGRKILFTSIYMMGNREDGEDAAQEAMLKMYQSIGKLKSPEAFGVWMYRVVWSTCKQMKKRMSLKKKTASEEWIMGLPEENHEFLPSEYLEDKEKRELLFSEVKKLPDVCKSCLLLHYYEGMSYADIGKVLEISSKKVDNSLMKAKRLLVQSIERKTGVKSVLQNVYAAASAPVLTQAFQMQANMIISEQAVNSLVASSLGGISAAGVVTATASSIMLPGMSAAAKIAMGVAVASVSAIGGGLVISNSHQTPQVEGIVEQIQPTQEVPAPKGYDGLVFDSEDRITQEDQNMETEVTTLEDMIGEENAARLRAYAQQENDAEELDEFLIEIGMEPDLYLETIESKEQYISYYMVKQSKMLVVIRKGGGLSFLLTSADEPYLEDGQVIVDYEKWR